MWCVLGVLHPSCLERDWKHHLKLEKHHVICCKECKEKHKNERELVKLQKSNYDLKLLIRDKDLLVKKFEDEKKNVEEELRSELTIQKKELINKESYIEERVNKLKTELDTILRQKVTLENEKTLLMEKCKVLEEDLSELRYMNNSMLTSIRVLESNNRLYQDKAEKLKRDLDVFKSNGLATCSAPQKNGIVLSKPPSKVKKVKKPKIRIISNKSFVGRTSVLLKKLLDVKFDTNSQYIMRAEDLVDSFLPLTSNFTRDDFVLFFIGNVNDFKGRTSTED